MHCSQSYIFQNDSKQLCPNNKPNRQFSESAENSVGSSNISSLISSRFSTSYTYSNVTKSEQLLIKQQNLSVSSDKESVVPDKCESLKKELINKIVSQLDVMFQISKALNKSYNKHVIPGDVEIEAEKILLIASKYIFALLEVTTI